jgi:hypothetical protein
VASLSWAGTLTVTSPTNGAYLGTSNQLNFNITGASLQVTVTVLVTFPGGATTSQSQYFNPNPQGQVSGQIPLAFNSSDPQGQYGITVTATEPNNTYAPTNLTVTVLPTPPTFNSYSPVTGSFVNGTIHIRASINDGFLKQWRVQVNGQDIPNNTGTTTAVAVDWNSSAVPTDGVQTVTIVATDLANNSATQTAALDLTRVPPILTVVSPVAGGKIVPGTDVNVLLSLQGEFAGCIDRTGIDVIAQTASGAFIARVAVSSFTAATQSPTFQWNGRIRYRSGLLPSSFNIVATAVDKAGNKATPQTISVTVGH